MKKEIILSSLGLASSGLNATCATKCEDFAFSCRTNKKTFLGVFFFEHV